MFDPRLSAAAGMYISANQPLFGGRVEPNRRPPGTPGPYAVYDLTDWDQIGALRGARETHLSGLTAVTLTLTVWDDVFERACAAFHGLNGRRDEPGMNGFRGHWPYAGLTELGYPDGLLAINPCLLVPGSPDVWDELDGDQQETGWVAIRAVYRIHYVEG